MAAFALVAALGYWLLQHAAKETAVYVKRTGTALGMTLAVIGLLGVLARVAVQVKKVMLAPGMVQGTGIAAPVLPPATPGKTK